VYGFAHLQFGPDHAIVRFVDRDGNAVHIARRDVDSSIAVIDSTGQDSAQPRTVKSITRPDAATAPAR